MASGGYAQAYRARAEDPVAFWGDAAKAVSWIRKPRRVLDATDATDASDPDHPSAPVWYPDGRLNVCYNALDRHIIEGRADQTALIHESPVASRRRVYSYAELLDLTARFAGGLEACGIAPGDTVLIALPTSPEAVIAILACARIGAAHTVVPGDLDPAGLAIRLGEVRPKLVVAVSDGRPRLDAALGGSGHQPETVVILQRPPVTAPPGPKDVEWATLITPNAVPPAGCVTVAATHPLLTLYPSARPAGIVCDSGGYAAALAWSMRGIFDIGPGDVTFTAEDLGSEAGIAAGVYGPLLVGATTVLSDGEPESFPAVIREHRVTTVFAARTGAAGESALWPGGVNPGGLGSSVPQED